ncbi:MAG: efflux RND transporter periplasmic adaptor subunit [Acutalibacteraceae bacterium]|nr:efflux RND transporter periplasmic adaptor subunit [Acutalibacteraceae bacterium]
MKKKIIIIISIVVVLIVAVIAGVIIFQPMGSVGMNVGDSAVVTQIAEINGLDIAFSSNRYSGIVEMQEFVSVKADADKVIKETFVKVGDSVKKGDKLFEYDIEQMKIQLTQNELDLEQAETEIKMCNSQISTLENQKRSADQNTALGIESQILSLQLEIKRAEYTASNKKEEIKKLKKSIENNVVKAETNGKIQSVGNSDAQEMVLDNAYITIATNDDYRVKAMISEENIDTFYKDAPIIVRSRIDESKSWTGKVTSIDTTAPSNTGSDVMSGESDTKYPVYIELDSVDALMIGQHVTVELNVDSASNESKLWLDGFYICDAETAPYVWCMGKDNLLEKRSVELGEFNEMEFRYEIVSGLTQEDYVSFPEEHLTEGMPATVISVPEILDEAEAEAMEVL